MAWCLYWVKALYEKLLWHRQCVIRLPSTRGKNHVPQLPKLSHRYRHSQQAEAAIHSESHHQIATFQARMTPPFSPTRLMPVTRSPEEGQAWIFAFVLRLVRRERERESGSRRRVLKPDWRCMACLNLSEALLDVFPPHSHCLFAQKRRFCKPLLKSRASLGCLAADNLYFVYCILLSLTRSTNHSWRVYSVKGARHHRSDSFGNLEEWRLAVKISACRARDDDACFGATRA